MSALGGIDWNDPNTWPAWVQNDTRLAGPISELAVTTANAHDNVGRLVVYRDPHWPEHRTEEGTITSANDSYVFVRFPGGAHGVACDPERLRYSIAAPAPGV